MRITYSPVEGLAPIELSVEGDVLTINGVAYDFSALADGDSIPFVALAEPLIVSDVVRIGGVVELTVILPHGQNAPEETRFPTPVDLLVNGTVEIPAYDV